MRRAILTVSVRRLLHELERLERCYADDPAAVDALDAVAKEVKCWVIEECILCGDDLPVLIV